MPRQQSYMLSISHSPSATCLYEPCAGHQKPSASQSVAKALRDLLNEGLLLGPIRASVPSTFPPNSTFWTLFSPHPPNSVLEGLGLPATPSVRNAARNSPGSGATLRLLSRLGASCPKETKALRIDAPLDSILTRALLKRQKSEGQQSDGEERIKRCEYNPIQTFLLATNTPSPQQ